MPYDTNALAPLLQTSGFNLWLYRTTDQRDVALADGYFAAASAQLASGDVILLQAADSLTLTTVRIGTAVAPGLVLDTFDMPFSVFRSASQHFAVSVACSATATTIALVPPSGGYVAGGTITAEAAVVGPVTQVAFSILDSLGATVVGPQTVSVVAGSASTVLAAPAAGTGYRLRAEAIGFPELVDTSDPFTVGSAFALLDQSGFALLAEDGGRLLI